MVVKPLKVEIFHLKMQPYFADIVRCVAFSNIHYYESS